jgi:hypothetical protein
MTSSTAGAVLSLHDSINSVGDRGEVDDHVRSRRNRLSGVGGRWIEHKAYLDVPLLRRIVQRSRIPVQVKDRDRR